MNIPKIGRTITAAALGAGLLSLLQMYAVTTKSAALDNPHTPNNLVSCSNCHTAAGGGKDFANQGDQTNGVCGQCHNPSLIATNLMPHVSTQWGTITIQCTECHNPHYQPQSRFYKDPSYAATGTLSTAPTAVTATTVTLSAALPAPPAGSASWVGYKILPDKRYTTFIYKIAAYDGNVTITIDTGKNGQETINTTYIKPGAAYAIVYGKLVKEYVRGRQVRFFRQTGTNSFADGDATYDGVCEVCHTQTAHFRNDGGAPDQLHTSLGSGAAGTVCKACHKHGVGFTGTNAGCIGCHEGSVGGRNSVGDRFRANSHHVQGVEVTNQHCYQCHWEANDDGTINTSYHSGSSVPGSAVDLVIYGAGARPTSYTVDTTAIQYTANGTRAEINKLTTHCLGCHSDQNNTTQPFAPADTRTPIQYAWDGSSVANRYNQAGTVPWGKYIGGARITPKNTVSKAYSAHGNAIGNQGGWDLNETWPNTRNGSVNVQCFDCHNSHGSAAAGRTSSYTSATPSGGILKETSADRGGYSVAYAPGAGGSAGTKDLRNAGASLCFDCHLTQTEGATTPWGYGSTFGASQQVLGYRDSSYFGPGASGYQQRYSYKGILSHKGGHFGASSPVPGATGTIDGLCTPCHDPHGVTNNTAKIATADKPYAVPLLKGTWMTSPYREDVAPANNTTGTINDTNAGNAYHIDQNTFGTDIVVPPATGITQTDTQFAGLCLTCHPKNSLTDGANGGIWKSVDRIHESVNGWGANTKHKYSCSKCHTPHNSRLPRLMATNCFNTRHKGRVGGTTPVLSGYAYNCGLYPGSLGAGCGGGEGWIPGTHQGGEGYDPGISNPTYVVSCHENQSADQSWNDLTPWSNMHPSVPTLIDEPDTLATSVQLQWSASTDPEGDPIQYYVQVDDASNFSSPNYSSGWISGTNYSLAVGNDTLWYWRVKARDATTESAWSAADSFMVSDGNAPPQVTLSNPATGALYNYYPTAVLLQWNAVPPLAQYRLEVDNEAGFSAPLVYDSGWITATYQSVPISAGGTYYWRVQARDSLSLATGMVSETRNFIANKPPTAPVLIDEPDTTSTSIQLQWNASTDPEGDAVQYSIQIDDASNFLTPDYTADLISGTSYSLTVGTNTTWYWRVKAKDAGSESGWSMYDPFMVSDGNAPPQATLLSPANGFTYYGIPVIVSLQWNAVPPFAQYRLEVDNESGFSAPLVYDSGWTTVTSQTVTLTAPGTYYWRVQARDTVSGATGMVSDIWTVVVNGPPTVPVLIDEPHTASTNITLDWNASTDPEGNTPLQYYAVVDDDPNFGSPNFGGVWQSATSLSFTSGMNTVWYWRVKARDSLSVESAWSSADIFAVADGTPPPAPTLSSPANGWSGTTACDTLGYWVTFSYYSEPATEYRVFVDDDPAFGSVNYDSGWTASISWGADISSNWGTIVYYWKVGARDPVNTGTENWSGSQTFTIYYGGGCPKSSCPFVFVWDGQKYGYVTDLQGAPIGYAAGSYMVTWPPYFRPEFVVFDSLKPDAQGKYNLKLREPLPEISYFDEAKLLAVDYPAGYELASSTSEMTYRFKYANPFKLYTLKDPRQPVSVVDQNGVDALASVLETDGNLLPMQLFALNSYLLDFGPIDPANAKLVIDGWSVFGSAYSTTLPTVQPFIEVVDASGRWLKVKSFGEPAGDMKRMVIDLSGLFPSSDRRIRLNTGRDSGMAWRIDKISIDDSAPVAMTINEINAYSADLHYRGRAPFVSSTLEHRITAWDDVMADDPSSYGFGNFTKYGDVKALLTSTDDMFAIMRHGDEISLTFSGPSAPVPAGMQRSFVLKADVYYKTFRVDKNVELLPFHGMSMYPYDPAVENYPTDPAHEQYRQNYNTRIYSQ